MKFQCLNESCKKLFHYTAKKTELFYSEKTQGIQQLGTVSIFEPVVLSQKETSVCPYCGNLDFTEYIEPAPIQEAVSNVYVYDLTSGAQTALDALLAQGYKIQQRYAKQYFLEKPKPTEA